MDKRLGNWMERKRHTEGAGGLWRIDDKIYDLNSWINQHPGGSQWIEMTKGTDITELFETHHISEYPETLLSKYEVGPAKTTARCYPYTFRKDGFYNTLKARIRSKLTEVPKYVTLKSILITDSMVMISLLLSVMTARQSSFLLASATGLFLALSAICAHNFLHSRNNWRMYYFCLPAFSIKYWRITHMFSHHVYTNTADDMEIILFQPFLCWLPKADKLWVAKHLAVFYSPVVYMFTTFKLVLDRILRNDHELSDLLVFIIPSLMYVFSSQSMFTLITLWIWILMFSSLVFVFIGITAGHHHPSIYHEGDDDQHKKDQDWGVHQLNTTRDRIETKHNTLLSLITFGDHILHHLFPTIDHAYIPYLYSEVEETCRQFGIDYKTMPAFELIRGQYQRLSLTSVDSKIK